MDAARQRGPTHAVAGPGPSGVRDFSENEVKQLLRTASTVMRNAGCPVTFTLEGAVRTFSSANVPNNIVTEADLDKVHGEPANVKIVKEIHCCVGRKNKPDTRF